MWIWKGLSAESKDVCTDVLKMKEWIEAGNAIRLGADTASVIETLDWTFDQYLDFIETADDFGIKF